MSDYTDFNPRKQWADFWMSRVGWEPSWAARNIAERRAPDGLVADIGGSHGRDSLWLSARGYRTVLLEPNPYSLKMALDRAKAKDLHLDLIRAALPDLPVPDSCFQAVGFHWGLHSYPDQEKPAVLEEINRVMVRGGLLFSASFGSWSGYAMPSSIQAVARREDFIAGHEKAGFRTISVTERIDETYTFEKSWCGEFTRV